MVYLLFSANTVTGKSTCSHPALPEGGEGVRFTQSGFYAFLIDIIPFLKTVLFQSI
jgi:hypothetical protein